MGAYPYTNLTGALRDSASPLRRHLDRTFPHVRALQDSYRAAAGELLVDTIGAPAAVLGTAFDLGVRFRLVPTETPLITEIAFSDHPRERTVVRQLARVAGEATRLEQDDYSLLARACWALALCVGVYREGVRPDSPLVGLLGTDDFRPGRLLELAPSSAQWEFDRLDALAGHHLLPRLNAPFHLGATFDGSVLCAADADLIADRLLVDIKTRLGPKDKGTIHRSDRLRAADIYQLLSYALFDRTDHYGIDAIAIYSGRYGTFMKWSLLEALETLAGGPVDLSHQHDVVWRLLGGN